MAGIHESLLQTIRDRLDIAEVIQRYIPLKRSGSSLVACCPFHKEKTPSFHVNARRQFYYCFGCNASGDIFDFVQRYEGKRFPEVLRDFAQQLNLTLPDPKDFQFDEEAEKKKERLHQVLQMAQHFFRHHLKEASPTIRGYLEGRGVTEAALDNFGLGYAPDAWGMLRDHLAQHGVPSDIAIEAGLLKPSEEGQHVYDRFRHRITFPIYLPSGRIVGFGGRVLRELDGAKYLNSPESPLFQKSEILYGLHLAQHALRKGAGAIVVEGYLDVLALHQAGFSEAVATLGTAFSAEHAKLLKRYTEKVLLLFDGDAAGIKATERALGILLPAGFSVEVLHLPSHEDPDSFLRTHGKDAFQDLLTHQRRPAFDAYLDHLRLASASDPILIRKATQQILDLLKPIDDPILQDLYVKKVAQTFGIEDSALRRQMIRLLPAASPSSPSSRPSSPSPSSRPSSSRSSSQTSSTPRPLSPASPPTSSDPLDYTDRIEEPSAQILLKIFLDHKILSPEYAIESFVDRFTSSLWRPLLERILVDHSEGADAVLLMDTILTHLDRFPAAKKSMTVVLMKDPTLEEASLPRVLSDLDQFFDRQEKRRHTQSIQRRLEQFEHHASSPSLPSLPLDTPIPSEPSASSHPLRSIQDEDARRTAWEKAQIQRQLSRLPASFSKRTD